MRTERELFNEWLKHYEECDVKIDQLQRVFMWQAWKASANRQSYKLVPVEPTIDMIKAYYSTPKPTAERCYKSMIAAVK